MGLQAQVPDAAACEPARLSIRVSGLVQGVGFRPHVHRIAAHHGVQGFVLNDADGVLIEAQGRDLSGFLNALGADAPPLARIASIQATPMDARPDETAFTIRPTRSGGAVSTAVPADAAICADCLHELFDPNDRRHLHPFTSCCNCGPRYTITRSLPYDRAQTSMAEFPMCPACAPEYRDPADRRFHAEPVACPDCGPRLDMPVDEIAARIGQGEIVAIKGLGGFHLACDARNADAVDSLRARKHRDGKPFAVMVLNHASAMRLATITERGRAVLESTERPVVVLETKPDHGLADGVSNGLPTLGLMLPYTPVHHLLFHALAGRPDGHDWLDEPCPVALVMTSANRSGEPLVIDEAEAHARLDGIADAIAGHDRAILVRADDSVLAMRGEAPLVIRRARGHTPRPIRLARPQPATLALGGHLKVAVTVTRGNEAFVSQHVGDLDTPGAVAFLRETVDHLLAITEVRPELIACDMHPDFASSRLAAELANAFDARLVPVQHHHAHIAAVTAEHGHEGAVLGLALDGYGMGSDGGAWGGELLAVDGASFDRLGHLAEIAQPGGDVAAREPWRMAAAALFRLGRGGEITDRFADEPLAPALSGLLERGLAPTTTSAGRWFDAAAGLLGLARRCSFEGEAAMRLEGLVTEPRELDGGWRLDGGTLSLDPLFAHLAGLDDASAGANLFHGTLSAALADWSARAASETGLKTVALAGGCFLNRVLLEDLTARLARVGLTVLVPRELPPNDGGLSFGQAAVAGHVQMQGAASCA